MPNLRSLPLDIETDDPETWLEAQSEPIRQVTCVENGSLVQRPCIEGDAYVDPTAQLIGGVIVRSGCYIGPFAVVRLDETQGTNPLIIGADTNLQDFSLVHSNASKIGDRVIVAHQAIIHGARVENDVTIYIQAVVDGDGTVLGEGAFLHRGSYVGKGIVVPRERFVGPGVHVLTQTEADALPEVSAPLRDLRAHVLELNRAHCRTYGRMR